MEKGITYLYIGKGIDHITDCPNPGDFEKVQKNLKKAIEMQEEFFQWKNKQPREYVKGERSLN